MTPYPYPRFSDCSTESAEASVTSRPDFARDKPC